MLILAIWYNTYLNTFLRIVSGPNVAVIKICPGVFKEMFRRLPWKKESKDAGEKSQELPQEAWKDVENKACKPICDIFLVLLYMATA